MGRASPRRPLHRSRILAIPCDARPFSLLFLLFFFDMKRQCFPSWPEFGVLIPRGPFSRFFRFPRVAEAYFFLRAQSLSDELVLEKGCFSISEENPHSFFPASLSVS